MGADRRVILQTLMEHRDRLIAVLEELDREHRLTWPGDAETRRVDPMVIHDLRRQLLDVEVTIARLGDGTDPPQGGVDEAELASSVDVDGG